MIQFATSSSTIAAITIVLASCFLAIAPYFVARKLLLPITDEKSKDLAGSVMFRVGALHSLILALVFAQELLNFSEARHTMMREAALVGNVYYDLKRYDDAQTTSAQKNLIEYTRIVLEREWRKLAEEGRLDEQAWQEWQAAYMKVLDLVPVNARQEALKEIMIHQVRELSELRIKRETEALTGTNALFMFAAIAGIVIMSIAYFPFSPNRVNLLLLLLFGVYTGLVIYFIVAFSNPFSGAGYVEPVRLERLYDGMMQTRP